MFSTGKDVPQKIPFTFDALREANTLRLPQFKNGHGRMAHAKEDGSDWTPAQWLQAVVGELGEWATIRVAFERGELSFSDYERRSAKELADVVTYIDILARRSLDVTSQKAGVPDGYCDTPSRDIMNVIAALGELSNTRKKFDRGDYDAPQYEMHAKIQMGMTINAVDDLRKSYLSTHEEYVSEAHVGGGVDLGAAIVSKFNEVTQRVGSSIEIVNGVVIDHNPGYDERDLKQE